MVFLAVLRDPARLHLQLPVDPGEAVGRAGDVRLDPAAVLPAVDRQFAGALGQVPPDLPHLLRHPDPRYPGAGLVRRLARDAGRSEEHTSELHSLMRISYAVF